MLGWLRILRTVSVVVALVLVPARAALAEAPKSSATSAALEQELTVLEAWVHEHGGRLSASFVRVEDGRVLAQSGADQALNPASNAKLLTAGAVLSALGPSHQFHTGVYGSIARGEASTLVLRGDGDPSLSAADLDALVSVLLGKGLRKVGTVQVDQSRFDDHFVPPAFEQQPNEWAAFRAPVSAVAVAENALTVFVDATRAGQPARVWVEPPGAATLSGTVTTAARGKGQAVRVSVKAGSGPLQVVVGGRIAEGLPMMVSRRRVDDPRRLPGYVFVELLKRRGVTVSGGVVEGGAAETHALALHTSEPLAVLLFALGKNSDNFAAEMMLKALGAHASGGVGTSAAGAKAVQDWVSGLGVSHSGLVIRNGSGLFDANRVSAGTLTGVLRHAYQSPSLKVDYLAQLSIGGVDGTLRSRFRTHANERNVRAKTGTLARVIALSGILLAPPGHSPIAFSVIVDGVPGRHAQTRKRVDRAVERAFDALGK